MRPVGPQVEVEHDHRHHDQSSCRAGCAGTWASSGAAAGARDRPSRRAAGSGTRLNAIRPDVAQAEEEDDLGRAARGRRVRQRRSNRNDVDEEHGADRRPGRRWWPARPVPRARPDCAGCAVGPCSPAPAWPSRRRRSRPGTSRAGTIKVPTGSTWASGLRVSRPARAAVSSPKARATQPWETSWRMMEGTITQKRMMSPLGDVVVRDQGHDDDDAGRRSTGRAWCCGPWDGGPEVAPARATYCLAASTMQKRAAGMASRRAAPIGLPQASHRP